ncbi:MAG TPA: isoprenylcysteine carboxylmethyltransferase family protein [Xanthobacteraceae bacterium]|nr:isoprenylcysteine carboxylmethyltransferase family protein [Xanthobacteraceae bacterium]
MGEGGALVVFIAAQRLAELWLAHRNSTRLLAGGGVEFGRAHYRFMVALHAAWLVGLWLLGRDRPVDSLLLGVFALLQAARVWVILSLGRRWTTRVIVLPGQRLVARGPYRWLRHPNYLVVALEIAVVPLALGLPVFAAVFTALNALLLYRRIGVENAALAWASSGTAAAQTLAKETRSL